MIIGLVPSVFAVGCAATVGGSAVVGAGVTTSPAPSSSGAASNGTGSTDLGGTPIDRAAFLADLIAANATVTSVRGAVEVDGPSQVLATFDATQSGGAVADYAIDMRLTFDGEQLPISLRRVDGRLYLAGELVLSAVDVFTPWLLLDPPAPDPVIAGLAEEFDAVTGEVGSAQVEHLRSALVEVLEVGPVRIEGPNGTGLDVTHYRGLIAGSALIELEAERQVLPVDLYLDDQGRPVLTITTAEVAGRTITAAVRIDSYDEPITVTAPDPAEVTVR